MSVELQFSVASRRGRVVPEEAQNRHQRNLSEIDSEREKVIQNIKRLEEDARYPFHSSLVFFQHPRRKVVLSLRPRESYAARGVTSSH